MSYTNPKYKITAASKSNKIIYVYLTDNSSYSGTPIEYPSTNISLQYLPKSDDTFEPIIASQLNLSIDVTDNQANMPDFTSLDDRKYLVQVYIDSTIYWTGWSMSDSVTISYTTGRKEVSFNAVDGLGMLEKILYPISTSYYLTELDTCTDYILNSLLQIGFPTGLNIVNGISYFAQGMIDRSTDTSNEPFSQTFIRLTTFLDDNSVITNCLDILKQILSSFGARIFQAENKWFIVTPTEFAQSSYYYTETQSDGTFVTSGLRASTKQIQGFTDNTSGLYFVDNSQNKILKKGYNKIKYVKDINYPSNFISNANLKIFSGDTAFAWSTYTTGTGGSVKLKNYTNSPNNSWVLNQNPSTTLQSGIIPLNIPEVKFNDTISLSLDFTNIVSNSSATKMCFVYITLTSGTIIYHLNSNKAWTTTGTDYYYVKYDGGVYPAAAPSLTKTETIDIPPAPLSGVIYISVYVDSTCISFCEVSNMQLNVSQLFKQVTTQSYITNIDEYVYTPNISLGYNYSISGKYYYRGFFSDSSGNILTNWYRMEYPTDYYNSLCELIIKQYSNILENNIINIDSSIYGIDNNTRTISMGWMLTSTDTDTVNSVASNKYLIGNSTFNLVSNEIQATLLDINDNNISTTLTTTYVNNNPARVFGRQRSLGQTTSAAALAASLTSNIIYQSGDRFYIDSNVSLTFNGGNLYYKVQSEDVVSTSIFHIDPTGKIIAFSPR